ncbi:MAG: L,D-transpeptidase family protein [Rhodobacteraceae bacterium]|nr:L,D-transpeptidase family protein [Paracoccaceae bacterium]
MWLGRVFSVLIIALGLAACEGKFKIYNGPKVTSIQVHKSQRKMYLLHGNELLKEYKVSLGKNPVGPKQFEGDGKTPEGVYYISHKNPRSRYHLSLGVSYPNSAQIAFARQKRKPPGGDIFIHGGPLRPVKKWDWTEGCIAVTDEEMEEIYSMVNPGTSVRILP